MRGGPRLRELVRVAGHAVHDPHRLVQDQLQDLDINHRFGDEGRCDYSSFITDPSVVPSEGEGWLLVDPSRERRVPNQRRPPD